MCIRDRFSIALTESKLPGIVELVPTYRSLMVHYDPEVIPYGCLLYTSAH